MCNSKYNIIEERSVAGPPGIDVWFVACTVFKSNEMFGFFSKCFGIISQGASKCLITVRNKVFH